MTSKALVNHKNVVMDHSDPLNSLLEVISKLRWARSIQEKLQLITEGVALCGWQWVHLYIYDPDKKLIKSAAYWGATKDQITYLEKHRLTIDQIENLLSPKYDKYKIGRCYYIPHTVQDELVDKLHEISLGGTTPMEKLQGWHPDDFMFVPLIGKYSKKIMGLMNLDDPVNRIKPNEASLRPVELFIDYASSVIEEFEFDQYFSQMNMLLSQLFSVSPIMIFLSDDEGNIINANEQSLLHFGYSMIEIIRMNEKDLFADTRDYFNARKGREGGKVFKQEVIFSQKNRKQFWGYLTTVTVTNELGSLQGNIIMILDTTESKVLQQQLIQAEKLAGIGILASGIAHELNNPLYGILGLAEEIMAITDDNAIIEHSRDLIEYATQAAEIVKDLSNYSYSSKNDVSSTANVNKVLNTSIRILDRLGKFKDIEIVKDFVEVPEINASFSELQQLFINILNNSIDALPRGGTININTRIVGNFIEVKVIDDGSGITQDNLNKVFEPFFTTKGNGEGTGLGLFISYKIATKYNGNIEIENGPDKGTIITVRLLISR
ncbi:PAS domain-containing protein [bacterium]|nr:PAS domain-containing protein [bacterium]